MFWFAGAIAILFGLAVCFSGYKMFKFFLGAVGLTAGAYIGYTWLGTALGISQILAAVVLGLLFACLAFTLFRTGVALTGAILGVLLLYLILAASNVQPPWWTAIAGALGGSILAGLFIKPYIVIGSSFYGAYLAAWGVNTLAAKSDALTFDVHFSWPVYAAIIVITIIGASVQFKNNRGKR